MLFISGGAGGGGGQGDETVGWLPFAWNTPSPLVLQGVAAGQLLNRVSVLLIVPFNGEDPPGTLEVGTLTTPDLVFTSADIDTEVAAQTDSDALELFAANDTLILTIDPGDSSAGNGIILWKVK